MSTPRNWQEVLEHIERGQTFSRTRHGMKAERVQVLTDIRRDITRVTSLGLKAATLVDNMRDRYKTGWNRDTARGEGTPIYVIFRDGAVIAYVTNAGDIVSASPSDDRRVADALDRLLPALEVYGELIKTQWIAAEREALGLINEYVWIELSPLEMRHTNGVWGVGARLTGERLVTVYINGYASGHFHIPNDEPSPRNDYGDIDSRLMVRHVREWLYPNRDHFLVAASHGIEAQKGDDHAIRRGISHRRSHIAARVVAYHTTAGKPLDLSLEGIAEALAGTMITLRTEEYPIIRQTVLRRYCSTPESSALSDEATKFRFDTGQHLGRNNQ